MERLSGVQGYAIRAINGLTAAETNNFDPHPTLFNCAQQIGRDPFGPLDPCLQPDFLIVPHNHGNDQQSSGTADAAALNEESLQGDIAGKSDPLRLIRPEPNLQSAVFTDTQALFRQGKSFLMRHT